MAEVSNTSFQLRHDRGGRAYAGLEIEGCVFDNCSVSLTSDPARMSRVSDVALRRCTSFNSRVGPCRLDDVLVEDLKTGDLLVVWGALFRHVTLRGKIGNVKVNRAIQDPYATAELQRTFDLVREEHYRHTDWAIDISQARLALFEVEGIPADLIRRDPATQVVVRKDRLSSVEQLAPIREDYPLLAFSLELFLESPEPDKVLVAPKGRAVKAFRQALAGLMRLRELGIADSQ